MQRRKGFCVRCQTEVEFSPSGRHWERERMRPHWCEDPTPLATEHECLGCGQTVLYAAWEDPRLDPEGNPHECVTSGELGAPERARGDSLADLARGGGQAPTRMLNGAAPPAATPTDGATPPATVGQRGASRPSKKRLELDQ